VDPATYYSALSGRNDVPPDALARKFADRLGDVLSLLTGGERVVEVGCAEGKFGAAVKARVSVHYTGVEPSTDADSASAVLDRVVHGTSEELRDGPYDLVMAFHVLEHIPDVAASMRQWHDLLSADGTLVLETPEEAGHRLLSWDSNSEHLHFFTAASLLALCQRVGFQAMRLTSGHFESVVYPDCLRLVATPRVSPARRRTALVARFRSVFPQPFAVYGIGGDFHNYVEPFLDALPVAALLDSDQRRHGRRIGDQTVAAYDSSRHGKLPILISSVRFKTEIAAWLAAEHGVVSTRIRGLDDIYCVGDPMSSRRQTKGHEC